MALTAAQRKRRSRKHLAGDHSLCDPGRCHGDSVTKEPASPVTAGTPRPPELGRRGRRLWREVTGDGQELTPTERVLLEEACRTADRLDVFDKILRGEDTVWMRFHSLNEDGSIVKVVLNSAISEARQQQVALKQVLGELRQSRAAGAGKVPSRGVKPAGGQAPGQDSPGGARVPGSVADLTARIAERRNQTAG